MHLTKDENYINKQLRQKVSKGEMSHLFTKLVACGVVIHERSVGTLFQEVFHLLFGQGASGLLAACVLLSVHGLEDGLVEAELEAGPVKHLPFVGVPGDQAVDFHLFLLTDAVAPGHGL